MARRPEKKYRLLPVILLLALLLGACAARDAQATSDDATSPTSGETVQEASVVFADEDSQNAVILPADASPPPHTPQIPQDQCEHPYFVNGVCDRCGYICPHPEHDRETRLCAVCRQPAPHHYVNGVCACGEEYRFTDSKIPAKYYCVPGTTDFNRTAVREGRVLDEPWYYTYDDPKQERTLRRDVQIYLPWGYDETRPYKVLVLLHFLHGSENTWTTDFQYAGDERLQMKHVFDLMIQDGYIDPMIVVAPSLYVYDEAGRQLRSDYDSFASQLRETILPYVAETYSTYAASGAAEDLIAARRHFAIGGNSWGSYFTYEAGMIQNLPYFSSFICLSGDTNNGLAADTLNSEAMREYPVDLYYCAAGDMDIAMLNEQENFYTIVRLVDRLTEGQNAFFHITQGGGHDWLTWGTEIYNALPLAFGEDG